MVTHTRGTRRRNDGAPRDHLFTMYLSAAEHESIKARAEAREISAAEYVRQALHACAIVGGPEELTERHEKRTKGKTKNEHR